MNQWPCPDKLEPNPDYGSCSKCGYLVRLPHDCTWEPMGDLDPEETYDLEDQGGKDGQVRASRGGRGVWEDPQPDPTVEQTLLNIAVEALEQLIRRLEGRTF